MAGHILIVEDNEDNEDIRTMLQAGLELEGHRLSFAGDGLEAREHQPITHTA